MRWRAQGQATEQEAVPLLHRGKGRDLHEVARKRAPCPCLCKLQLILNGALLPVLLVSDTDSRSLIKNKLFAGPLFSHFGLPSYEPL